MPCDDRSLHRPYSFDTSTGISVLISDSNSRYRSNGLPRQGIGDGSAPIAPVEYLEAARPFASDHRLGMPIAELDLTNVPSSSINFFGYQRRPSGALSGPAWRNVAASIAASGQGWDRNRVRASFWLIMLSLPTGAEATLLRDREIRDRSPQSRVRAHKLNEKLG